MVTWTERFENMKLTHKQQRFIDEYLLDLNATKAAIRAGYSAKTARQMGAENLSKPAISEAIATSIQQRNTQARVDSDWVLSQAIKLYEMAWERSDLRTALRALEMIGKHVDVQAFKERVEVEKVDHAAILEERIAAAEKLRKRLN